MIDTMLMAESMKTHGFRNIQLKTEFGGVPFDIVAEAKAGLVKQTILVSSISSLDRKEAARVEADYMRLDSMSRGAWVGKIFAYCLFAEKVEEEVAGELIEKIRKNDMKASNFVKGGGGAIIVIETSTRGVGGYYPRFVGMSRLAEVIGETMDPPQPDNRPARSGGSYP